MVYLDYSATSPLLPCAKQAMIEAMNLVGNPSALHTPGHLAMNAIEDAREKIAKLINAEPEEILFTSGGTESNNTVINIFAGQLVAISAIEHPSLLESARLRCDATIIPVDKDGVVSEIGSLWAGGESATTASGGILRRREQGVGSAPVTTGRATGTPEVVATDRPSLISVMLANNEIGIIQDIKSLVKLAHARGALFHTDATQALGKIPIDVKKLDIDYMTLSSHKIGGPVGIGALYIRKDAPFRPFMIGGHQERGRRAGTYQTVNIAGFGAAAEYTVKNRTPEKYQKFVMPLRDLLAKQILEKIPHSSINTPLKKSLPHLLNCSFEAAEGESIQLYLDAEGGIITSTGSACASGDGKPSHVIMATAGDAEVAHSSVRFSFGLNSTKADVEQVMKYLPNIVKRLQGISTIKLKEEKA